VFGQGSTSLVHRFVDTRVMIFLGTISYGIFLWNQAVIHWINFAWFGLGGEQRGNTLTVIAIALPATIAIATASWYIVERPAIRLKGRIQRG
jgi:peptidoglycan/LPS O-acetylase OafA/YrhL